MPRLRLAIPADVTRLFDSQVSQAQVDADTFLNSTDDDDMLASMIEDAANEFRRATDEKFGTSRKGLPGSRPTYESVTYSLKGHANYKAAWTGTSTQYLPQEVTTSLDESRILPFDSAEGDAVYFYCGLGGKGVSASDAWEDITDEEGETWAIIDHRSGEIQFDPALLYETYLTSSQGVGIGGRGQLSELRVAISYRYGGLGGSSNYATETQLSSSITDTQTGTVSVTDGTGFPSDGTKVVLIDREYIEVEPDPANDQMNIVTRGVRNTTPAAHNADASVYYTPPAIRKAVASRAGMSLIESSTYSGWLPDTDDSLDKGDKRDALKETWDTTITVLSGGSA